MTVFVAACDIAEIICMSIQRLIEFCEESGIETTISTDDLTIIPLEKILRHFPEIREEATFWANRYENIPKGCAYDQLPRHQQTEAESGSAYRQNGVGGWSNA